MPCFRVVLIIAINALTVNGRQRPAFDQPGIPFMPNATQQFQQQFMAAANATNLTYAQQQQQIEVAVDNFISNVKTAYQNWKKNIATQKQEIETNVTQMASQLPAAAQTAFTAIKSIYDNKGITAGDKVQQIKAYVEQLTDPLFLQVLQQIAAQLMQSNSFGGLNVVGLVNGIVGGNGAIGGLVKLLPFRR